GQGVTDEVGVHLAGQGDPTAGGHHRRPGLRPGQLRRPLAQRLGEVVLGRLPLLRSGVQGRAGGGVQVGGEVGRGGRELVGEDRGGGRPAQQGRLQRGGGGGGA